MSVHSKFLLLSTGILLAGCSHFTEDREVTCKVECNNCEHVVHECNGVSDIGITELK